MKFKNTLLSIVRHLLTAAGTAVVMKNAGKHPELSMVDPATIAGGITAALGLLWGARDEHKAENTF